MNAKRMNLVARSAICFLLCCSVSRGSLIISGAWIGTPTPGLPGYHTYTITATSQDARDKLIGFDFAGDAYGVFGDFNQVNPAGLPTVFNDNNALFAIVGADVMQDTQFRVKSTDGIAITPSESATSLRAAFAFLPAGVAAATNQLTFLQFVTNQWDYSVNGTMTVRNQAGEDRLERIFFSAIPEPLTISLLLLSAAICGGTIRRRI